MHTEQQLSQSHVALTLARLYNKYGGHFPNSPAGNKAEYAMILRAQEEDSRELEMELAARNFPFLYECCKEVSDSLPANDRFQAALLGFINGIRRFDVTRKPPVRLITYCVWWVRRELQELSVHRYMIHIPKNVVVAMNQHIQTGQEQVRDHKYASAARIRAGLQVAHINSLDAPLLDGDRQRVDNQRASGVSVDLMAEYQLVRKLMHTELTGRERDVLWRYEVEEETLDKIKLTYGCTRERVRQIRQEALKKLTTAIDRRKW